MGDIIKLEYGRLHNISYEEIEKNKQMYRQGLINLGNAGRNKSDDFWIKKIISEEGNIMVTDVRVPFEYETFKAAGAIAIRVECPRDLRAQRGTLIGEDDVTETGLDHITDWDYVVNNDSDYETLKQKALELAKELR